VVLGKALGAHVIAVASPYDDCVLLHSEIARRALAPGRFYRLGRDPAPCCRIISEFPANLTVRRQSCPHSPIAFGYRSKTVKRGAQLGQIGAGIRLISMKRLPTAESLA
jgi:hypothetical protein